MEPIYKHSISWYVVSIQSPHCSVCTQPPRYSARTQSPCYSVDTQFTCVTLVSSFCFGLLLPPRSPLSATTCLFHLNLFVLPSVTLFMQSISLFRGTCGEWSLGLWNPKLVDMAESSRSLQLTPISMWIFHLSLLQSLELETCGSSRTPFQCIIHTLLCSLWNRSFAGLQYSMSTL